MGDVARQGRTVLFVSHNLGAVSNLCSSALRLERGRLEDYGAVDSVISAYVKSNSNSNSTTTPGDWTRNGNGKVHLTKVLLLDSAGNPSTAFAMGETIVVEFDLDFRQPFPSVSLALHVSRMDTQQSVLHFVNEDCGLSIENLSAGCHSFRVRVPNCMLYPSAYSISIWVGMTHQTLDFVHDVANFSIFQSDVSKRTFDFTSSRGVYFQPSSWDRIS
jgi:lipopolysaccharide transport system ATP-binding protein